MTYRTASRFPSFAERQAARERAANRPASLGLALLLFCAGAFFASMLAIGLFIEAPTYYTAAEASQFAYDATIIGLIAFAAFALSGACLWQARP